MLAQLRYNQPQSVESMTTRMHELPQRHRITVEHFYRMAEAGLFGEDERVELIDGEVIDVPPMGHRHAGTLDHLARLLADAVQPHAIVRQQLPLRLGLDSEPLPDVAIVKPRRDYYKGSHPTPADALFVVEVSSTTLRFDLDVKVPIYARHGVAEAWVLDVGGEQVHYYRSLRDAAYTVSGTAALSGPLAITALGIEIDLTPLGGQTRDPSQAQ